MTVSFSFTENKGNEEEEEGGKDDFTMTYEIGKVIAILFNLMYDDFDLNT